MAYPRQGLIRALRVARLGVSASMGVLLAALPLEGTLGVAPAQAAPGRALPPVVLDRPMRGANAVRALGGRLAAVAALNGRSGASLQRLLTTDSTAWVEPRGRVYFVEPPRAASAAPGAGPTDTSPYPYDQTFLLHSRPGAQRTIYLDFDGATVTGTGWNQHEGFPTSPLPPYDTDGDPGTFGNDERDLVQSVWRRVAEDYAPFAVDVTTEPPPPDALDRTDAADQVYGATALVTPSAEARTAACGDCGGIAYLDVFNNVAPSHAYYQPALVFPPGTSYNAKNIADVISHEIGHNFGLNHDGTTGGVTYYPGHGSWAPIMGLVYGHPIVQWSKGEYTDADNTEDDLAIIAAGAPIRPDDHGDTTGAATSLGSGGSGDGTITTAADKDVFSLTQMCSGNVSVAVAPVPMSPDLDVRLRLLDGSSTELAVSDPTSATVSYDVASGLSASLTRSLPPGTYYLEVDGTGALDPATTGYSDYASLGDYTIAAQSCAPSTFTLSGAVRDGAGAPVRGAVVTLAGATSATAVTGAAGTYSFTGLGAGGYSLNGDAICRTSQTHYLALVAATVSDLTLANDPAACEVTTEPWIGGTSVLPLTGDDSSATVALPFPYRFYGATYTTAYVSTNGVVNFGAPDTAYSNTSIPNSAVPNAAVYGFWDDLLVDGSSSVRTGTSGAPGSRVFVVEWRNVTSYTDPNARFSFELVLFEDRNQRILAQYKDITPGTLEDGRFATIGKEDAGGTRASKVSFDRGVIVDGLSLRMPK